MENQNIPKYNVSGGNIGAIGDNAKAIYINPKPFDPHKKIMQIPPLLSSNFTGREEYILKIESLITKQEVIVLSGTGGIGKTQIVLKYVDEKHKKNKYKHIALINASSADAITQDYAKCLDIDIDENTISNTRHWSNVNENWLFVYDNVDDDALKSEFFDKYMVNPSKGHVIITSRLANWENEPIRIKKFVEDESIKFLNKKTGLKDISGAKLLVKELDNFPLALEQAGAYILSTKKSYEKYIELYRKVGNSKKLLFEREKPDKYHKTIAMTWQISIDKIATKFPLSKDLLYILSFFAPDNIPVNIFASYKDELPKDLAELFENELDSEEIIIALDNYSIVTFNDNYISIHKLVQEVIKLSIESKKWYIYAFNLIYSAYNYDYNNQDTWKSSIELVSHILNITDYTYENNLEKEKTAYFFNNLAELYKNQGKYEEAKPLYKKALTIRKEVLGLKHPDIATSCNGLAELYKDQGKYERAELLYKKALAITINGLKDSELATSYNGLAGLYYAQGKYAKTESLYKKALAINTLKDIDMATIYNNLAILYYHQGKFREAEQLYKKALTIFKDTLGLEHPGTLQNYNNLAVLYDDQGKYEQAELLHKKVLEIREKILGLKHPDTALSYNNLAVLYNNQGKYEQAELLYKKALKIREEIFGLKHPNTATSYNNLAEVYDSQRKYKQAESLHKKALKIRKEVLGERHVSTANSYNNLGGLYNNQGKYEQAELFCKKALAICEEAFGIEHPITKMVEDNLKSLKKRDET